MLNVEYGMLNQVRCLCLMDTALISVWWAICGLYTLNTAVSSNYEFAKHCELDLVNDNKVCIVSCVISSSNTICISVC